MAHAGILPLMREELPISEKRIIHCLNIDYGIEVAFFTFLPLGADINASIYKGETHDKRSYFIKIKRGHQHDMGVVIAELLHDAGLQQIIPPIKTLLGQSTKRVEDFTLIVYPFIEGRDGFHCNLTDNQWVKLGKALRQVHEMEVPFSIQSQLRRESYSPKWQEAVLSLFAYIDGEPTGDEIALKLLKFMKEHRLAILRLVERAQQLSQKLQEQSPKFVLCHSDIHGGNVLIKGDDTLYIVDWDDPIMAPKERDLMFIGAGVANVWNKPEEAKRFYRGYGRTEINGVLLSYYRHERIVEDIAVYGQALLLTMDGGEDREEMYKQFVSMFEPDGVVEIAFKTDEGLSLENCSIIDE